MPLARPRSAKPADIILRTPRHGRSHRPPLLAGKATGPTAASRGNGPLARDIGPYPALGGSVSPTRLAVKGADVMLVGRSLLGPLLDINPDERDMLLNTLAAFFAFQGSAIEAGKHLC